MLVASSSTDSIDKAIYEYCEDNSDRSSSSGTSDASGGSTDENYSSGALRFPIEIIQKQLRRASSSQAGSPSSVPSSNPMDEEEIVFSCAVGIHSKTDE